MRLESITFVLSTGRWPGGSKFTGKAACFEPPDRLDGTAFPQYKVAQLYYCDIQWCIQKDEMYSYDSLCMCSYSMFRKKCNPLTECFLLFQFIIFKNGAQSSAKNIHFGELHKILEL
jgi:hypothetical protein